MSTLTIISHTNHYISADGSILGFGPTVTEINHLLQIFDKIQHVAMLQNEAAPLSALPYISDRITFVPLSALGGKKLKDKLNLVIQGPKVLKIVNKAINQADYFQFRAPTGIGVYVIPYIVLFSKRKGWFKYAGNWNQKNAPIAYGFQRWLLKHQKRKVTINGAWSNQAKQCITFENPCLTEDEIKKGADVIYKKDFLSSKLTFCFVGRLEKEKGIEVLIEAFKSLNTNEKSQVNKIHIVGYSNDKTAYVNSTANCGLDFIFHGHLSRNNVHNIYKDSHTIILPSVSEGFPKVISEAMNYGCLPIVSNISSINNYIQNGENGFLLNTVSKENIVLMIRQILNLEALEFHKMIKRNLIDIHKFSYDHYNSRIQTEIL
ncbi:glycosyltransferase [uncultured Winogradskyella sp.]|uniref:glycosyltransferase n=1 Tax=uncultured Winogradskyella sp. TaxID=395353 RepID=UPI00262A6C63|nr:glycosyltransferase [uncultured Winogradskyella sp.]